MLHKLMSGQYTKSQIEEVLTKKYGGPRHEPLFCMETAAMTQNPLLDDPDFAHPSPRPAGNPLLNDPDFAPGQRRRRGEGWGRRRKPA